jgi:hypothetical protein
LSGGKQSRLTVFRGSCYSNEMGMGKNEMGMGKDETGTRESRTGTGKVEKREQPA